MFKQILKNLNILNIILIIFVISFVYFRLEPRLKSKATFIPKVTAEKAEEDESDEEEETALAPQEYKLIADNNLFHPDRKIPKIVVQKPEEKLPPPDFVLYGTMVTDDVKLAFIDDRKTPFTTPGGGKRSRTLKIGDTLSGYTVKDIDHEKAIMVRDGNEIVLRKSASQDKKSVPTAGGRRPPQPFRGAQQPTHTQPAVPLTPPTIITVPAVPVQPAAPKPTTPAPATPGSKTPAPRTPQQQQQQQPQNHNKTNNPTMPPR